MGDDFDLCGALRRIRRLADLSQRELAARAAVSASAVGHAEAGTRDLPVASLARAAAVAGLRLALLDGEGREVSAMGPNSVRDHGGRRFPAHLDTVPSEERWWRYEHRFDRPRPSFTFDRSGEGREAAGGVHGRPRTTTSTAPATPSRNAPRHGAGRTGSDGLRSTNGPSSPESCARWTSRSRAPARRRATTSTTARGGRSTRRNAPVTATWPDPLLPLPRARQPPAYQPRRGPLLGRPPRRGDRASPGAS